MILKGKKVVLRPLRISDVERSVKWFNDSEVNRFVNLREMKFSEEEKWARQKIKSKSKTDLFFCIETKEGVHIGNISLGAIHKFDKRAVFGIVIGEKEYWNHGYGSDASRTIINYGFTKLKLHRIQLDVYAFNKRAIKVYKKLGFKLEGIMRDHVIFEGKYYNAYLMGILDSEWKKINRK